MARSLDANLVATLDDQFLIPVLFADLAFDDGRLFLHTDLGTIAFRNGDSTSYDFTNSTNSWTANAGTLTTHAEYVTFATVGAADFMYSPAFSINGAIFKTVRARVRRLNTIGTWMGDVYYQTGGHGYTFSDYARVPDTTILNDWVILEWDMTALAVGGNDWITNTITSIALRFDNDTAKSFDVDWVEICPQYVGTGDLGSIEGIEERDDNSPSGIVLRLSGIDATLLNEALIENYYDRSATISLGVRNITLGTMVATPFEIFCGKMDQMRVITGGPTSVIEISVESELIEFERSLNRYFSDSQLQKEYAGDLGFQYMAAMVNSHVTVGSKSLVIFGTPSGSSTLEPRGGGTR